MVAELQTTDAAAINWQSVGSTEVPSPTLRLLARVPRVGDRPQFQPSQFQPFGQVPPDKRTDAEQAGDLTEAKSLEAESQGDGVQGLAADRAAPMDTPAGMRSRADLVSRLCECHAAIKPYAGVIVALALLASTGLLYWLVTGTVLNPREPQQQIGQDMLGQHSNEPEPDASLSVAPVWSASGSRPVVTEDSVSELNTSQRDRACGSAEAVADSSTEEIFPAPATVPTEEVAFTRIPRVKYVPTVSVPAIGPPAVVEVAPGGGFQASETRLADTGEVPGRSLVGTTTTSGGPVVVTHADTSAAGNPVPQPSSSPSIQPYPKTHYGPFDFVPDDAGEKDGSQSPMVARRPETSRTGQLPR